MEHGNTSVLAMETATPVAEREQAPVQANEGFYRRRPKDEPLFNHEQQEAFDKAFSRRERKIRGEYEAMRRDFFETIEITQQLLERCKDRVSVEDECAIRDGLQAMRSEYKWQKRR
jgi:hypothetical protein